jgi:hypothetical protein
VRTRIVSPVALSSALGEAVRTAPRQQLVRGPELLAGIDPPVQPAQHLPVQQPAAPHHDRHPPALEPLDRGQVQSLGIAALAQLRLGHRQHSERPVVAGRPRDARQVLEGLLSQRALAGARGRLHQLEQRAHRVVQLVRVGQLTASGGHRLAVAPEAVVEDGLREVGGTQRVALAARLRVGSELPGSALHLVRLPAVRRDEEPPVLRQRVAGDVLDGLDLFAGGLGGVQLAVDRLRERQQAQGDRQHGQNALGTGELHLPVRKRTERGGIP